MPATISGQLMTWHKVTLDFVAERAFSESPETFRDHRLDVTFTNTATGETFRAPGFFAADGDAADSGATSGDVWRVNFNPPSEGAWSYQASFRTGSDIAASLDPSAGAPTGFDGASGSFTVTASDKSGEDFRAKGMILQNPGAHYLQHQGDGDYFIRGGPGVPENFLASRDIDNTPTGRHDYATHVGDYGGDGRTWAGGKGEAILGAVNYLAEMGQNTIYVLTNTAGGDGQDVWPWAASDMNAVGKNDGGLTAGELARFSTYDVSKLAQWEIIFDHMDAKGIYKNILFQETENDQLLNNGGDVAGTTLSAERMIYMREMIARFGHNNGIQWNLGEENTNTNAERADMAEWTKAVDPYDHLVVIHSYPGQINQVYDPLLSVDDFDGTSFQTTAGSIRARTVEFRDKSEAAGDPWVLAWDEDSSDNGIIDAYSNNPDSTNEKTLRAALWGHLTAGGSGVNWYIKGSSGHSYDQNMDTFDGFSSMWTWTAAATSFFNTHVPFWEMTDHDALTSNGGDFVMADPGRHYVIYLPYGRADQARLNLDAHAGETFDVFWYDPRNGGALVDGGAISGGGVRSIGAPPGSADKDWVALVRNAELPDRPAAVDPGDPPQQPPVEPAPPSDDLVTLWLVDPDTDRRVAKLIDGGIFDPDLLTNGNFSVEAVVDPNAGAQSVRLNLGGRVQTESVIPYALFGDSGGDFVGQAAPSGAQAISAQVYSGSGGSGALLGATSLQFTIAEAEAAPAPPPPVNAAPIATDDAAATDAGAAVAIDVTANDIDPEDGALTLAVQSGPANGSVVIEGDRIVYAPSADFSGSDSFVYRVTDPGGLSDTARVTVSVGPAPEAPSPAPVIPFDLVVSASSDRSGATDLEGARLDGDAFVFTTGTKDARQVLFHLDDPDGAGKPFQTENVHHHDFRGGSAGAARAWDTATLADGAHTITARVVTPDGAVTLLTEAFVIDNVADPVPPAPQPPVAPQPPAAAPTGFVAPFAIGGPSRDFGEVTLYGFGPDGSGRSIGLSGDRLGVAGAGSASEIDFRTSAGASEKIGIDFGAAVDAITVRLSGLGTVGGAREAGVLTTYGADGAALDARLLIGGDSFDIEPSGPVRYATLEASPWVGDGAAPSSEPDISLISVEADYII